MSSDVRVRFAPSPTGILHIGGVRTALYNYLFAKSVGGKFILRIEDTDQSRFVDGAEDYIKNSLKWAGIDWGEGPDVGGEYGPYKQSERKDIYQKYAQKMLDEGTAYYAFDTPEELDEMRARLKEAKANSLNYNSISRMSMKNSLTLSNEEIKERINNGDPYVIRVKMPAKEDIRLNDMIRGWVNVHSSTLDDKVLMKSDGMPTYHLANVVDDHQMKITHVIRGEEWLPSAPLHVMLYKFLGWEDTMPKFAHLPLILKPDGNGKLSKRDADKHGFPIFPLAWNGEQEIVKGFKEEGYLSKAFLNFIALLGWNPGTENEMFSMDELIKEFSIDRINKAGAKFDIQKAIWFNQQYLKQCPISELGDELLNQAAANEIECKKEKADSIAQLLQERIDVLPELLTKGIYFFKSPKTYVEKVVRKKWNDLSKSVFQDLKADLENKDTLNAIGFQEAFDYATQKNDTHAGAIMQILRVAVTGEAEGPDLMQIMEILGTSEVISRIEKASQAFQKIKSSAT